jgi:hypothetical protein
VSAGADRRLDVTIGHRRARLAIAAVLGCALLDGAGAALRPALVGGPGPAAMVSAMSACAWVLAAVLFLRWIHRAVRNASRLGMAIEWSPEQVVASFFIPVLFFFRPYQAVRELLAASDPADLPDLPAYREREDAGYREAAREVVPSPRWRFSAPVLVWWLFYWNVVHIGFSLFTSLLLVIGSSPLDDSGVRAVLATGSIIDVAAKVARGVLCAMVIRGIDARQRERLRRLEAIEAARA